MRILEIVNDPAFAEIISAGELAWLEGRISDVTPGKPTMPCLARGKDVPAKKEEIVRQLWLRRLTEDYRYPIERIQVEYPITFGRDTSKRADIVVFDEDRRTVPYIMIEVKAPKLKDGKDQLNSYLKETAVVRTGQSHLAVGSSEFIILRPANAKANRIAPETLMIFLRSAPVQTILKWCQDGSQHPRFSERDLLAIPVPDAVADASAEIEAMVQSAFAARARSRALLTAAKHAVEVAIEQGEEAALAWLAQ